MAEQAKAPPWDTEDCLGSYLGEIAHSHPLSGTDQIGKRHAAILVFLGDADDKTQIRRRKILKLLF